MSGAHDDERFVADSANYRFLEAALSPGGVLGGASRVLDFGCGRGQFVQMAAQRGLNVEGVDTFEGGYADWRAQLPGDIVPRVRRIEDGRIPHGDSTFDAVVSNFVFEHIEAPPAALHEIARVLKPGGAFLALFPTADTWYEGHAGLFFAHWFRGDGLRRYLRTAHAAGFGFQRGAMTREEWVHATATFLESDVRSHRYGAVRTWWRDAFGEAPRSLAPDFVRYRLRQSRMAALAGLPAWALRAICHIRAGRVLMTINRKSEHDNRDERRAHAAV